MNKVYPSIEEIIPSILKARLPASLVEDITTRYATLGEKYLTEETTNDGRRINSCMNKSSIQDALEEVVDGVFNTLVWILKLNNAGNLEILGANPYQVLSLLIEVYSILAVERERDALANSHIS